MNLHKKGEKITIYNRSFNGKPIVEGQAILHQEVRASLSHEYPVWYVRFDGISESPVVRTLYPDLESMK